MCVTLPRETDRSIGTALGIRVTHGSAVECMLNQQRRQNLSGCSAAVIRALGCAEDIHCHLASDGMSRPSVCEMLGDPLTQLTLQ